MADSTNSENTQDVGGNQVGKNSELGLPFGKMQTIRIAFDVDGTLRSNKTPTDRRPNAAIVSLLRTLATFKNVEIFVWSGGGGDYARSWCAPYELPVKDTHYISKVGAPQMDIAIDDIQDTAIGKLNLIVREK